MCIYNKITVVGAPAVTPQSPSVGGVTHHMPWKLCDCCVHEDPNRVMFEGENTPNLKPNKPDVTTLESTATRA